MFTRCTLHVNQNSNIQIIYIDRLAKVVCMRLHTTNTMPKEGIFGMNPKECWMKKNNKKFIITSIQDIFVEILISISSQYSDV